MAIKGNFQKVKTLRAARRRSRSSTTATARTDDRRGYYSVQLYGYVSESVSLKIAIQALMGTRRREYVLYRYYMQPGREMDTIRLIDAFYASFEPAGFV